MNLEDINKQQEEYNEFLKKKRHLKKKVIFITDDRLDKVEELLYSDKIIDYGEENDKDKL